ncbi:MAG: transposase [Bacteroidales bacterium]|nr:transposase [Candidatus Liminaster caballi]
MKSERKVGAFYTEEFKLDVLRAYYESGQDLSGTISKFGGLSRSTFNYWLEKYPIDEKSLSLPREVILNMGKEKNYTNDLGLAQKRIKELEKALELEKFHSQLLDKIIEIAERDEHIQIRKKSGAKQ